MSDVLFPASHESSRPGMGGHHSASADSEVWLTPPEILHALGPFDLDPCACMEPRPWPTARRHYTRRNNGLLLEWQGRVWCNPPYGGPTITVPWWRRMANHNFGTMLIFARTETEAFHEFVWQRASGILFLKGRLFFHHPDGRKAAANAGAPSCLVAYGSSDLAALASAATLPGHLVVLR